MAAKPITQHEARALKRREQQDQGADKYPESEICIGGGVVGTEITAAVRTANNLGHTVTARYCTDGTIHFYAIPTEAHNV